MGYPIDFKAEHTVGKLGVRDTLELERVTPEKLDGVMWLDAVRVSKEGSRYVLRDTVTNRVLSRHDLIDTALAEAKRHNREHFR